MFSLGQHAASSRSYEFSWHAAVLLHPYRPLPQGRHDMPSLPHHREDGGSGVSHSAHRPLASHKNRFRPACCEDSLLDVVDNLPTRACLAPSASFSPLSFPHNLAGKPRWIHTVHSHTHTR
ncbi:hypothetical protein E2C01_066149 [Portunus trituberculatus]|uniref:Uncharacterized protein n=1 Tax=Portunus trituberculatus TaxID=210409 RepID=A0A5B7HQ68_PORTR|nr:hypothetical protein [Portunus trituberculatus]